LWYSRSLVASAQSSQDALLRVEISGEAFQAALRATAESEERPEAWFNLAAFYAAGNNLPDTERCLRTCAAWSPTWYKPHWMLGQILNLSGRTEEAGAEACHAVELDGGKHPEVSRTRDGLCNQRSNMPCCYHP
jgi:hypothetical protein